MSNLLKWAISILAGSAIAVIWGVNYRGDHQMAAMSAFFGNSDPVYSFAGWAIGLGILAFLIGIALLIAGLVRPKGPTGAS